MLKKFAVTLMCVSALFIAGCDSASTVADTAKEGVDSAAGAAKDAAGEMVPDAAKDTVDSTIDKGADAAKDGVEKAAEAVSGN